MLAKTWLLSFMKNSKLAWKIETWHDDKQILTITFHEIKLHAESNMLSCLAPVSFIINKGNIYTYIEFLSFQVSVCSKEVIILFQYSAERVFIGQESMDGGLGTMSCH
jgi:hypothetical protein